LDQEAAMRDAAEERFLQRVLDTYNSRRPETFDALLTEDCVLVRDGAEARGRESVKRVLAQLYRAIPDLKYRIDDAVISGDKTAIRWEGRGTFRADYLGIPATGTELSYGGITFYEMRGDLIARIWVSTNLPEQLRSLVEAELAPSSEEPPALH
jgi:steroid delta-isomerase-like uncharacterized protein